jgi:hypothetical protein
MRGISLDHLDQVGDQIGAALVLVEYLALFGGGVFVERRDGVDAATAERRSDQDDRKHLCHPSITSAKEGMHFCSLAVSVSGTQFY